jgi:hypothetical protein
MLQKSVIGHCRDQAFDFLYGYPNRLSSAAQVRAGFTVIGQMQRLVLVLNFRPYVERYLRARLPAAIIAAPLDALTRLRARFTRSGAVASLEPTEIETFDIRFDELWRRFSAQPLVPVTGVRDSRFLNWRFARCPYRQFTKLAVEDSRNRQLVGYAVYAVEGRAATIFDILALPGDRYIEGVLTHIIEHLRQRRIQTVSFMYFGNSSVSDAFRAAGFTRRHRERDIVVYPFRHSRAGNAIAVQQNWFMTEADFD